MRCLIVTYSFAPLNVISAQRTNSLASFLAQRGHAVDVLTAVKRPMDGPVDEIERWNDLRNLVNIHEVEFLGRTAQGYQLRDVNSQAGMDLTKKSSFLRRVLKRVKRSVGRSLGLLFDYRTVWMFKAIRYYKTKLSEKGYDVVVTSSGPVCVNCIGYVIKRISPGTRWIADFRDLWSLSHTSEVYGLTRVAEAAIERRLLRQADQISTVSEFLGHQMAKLHSKPVDIVRNGFEELEIDSIQPDRRFFSERGLDGRVNIVYAGSIYPGRRDPAPLIQAIKDLSLEQGVALHFFGFDLAALASAVKRMGATEYCFVHSSRPRRQILAIQKAADMNLFLESGQEDAKGVLTGKLFELAALKRPVLALGPPASFESIQLLQRTGLLVHWQALGGDLWRVFAEAERVVPDPDFIGSLARSGQFERLSISREPSIQAEP